MSRIFVCGLINLEVTVRVDAFPIEYAPVRYSFGGVHSSVSGVGFNIAKALTVLGDEVRFASIVGRDAAGDLATAALKAAGVDTRYIVAGVRETAHSVILYDQTGKRQINVDLKDIQGQAYPEELFAEASRDCELLALCNINFSRPLLALARQAGKQIATDVHAISDLDDDYNRDFMRTADILFLSDESLPCPPEQWVKSLVDRYGTGIVVVGLGANGLLLSVKNDGFMERLPAHPPPKIVNTIGAGDALFACFVHCFRQSGNPYEAAEKAALFAAHKIGVASAAEGFLPERELNRLYAVRR